MDFTNKIKDLTRKELVSNCVRLLNLSIKQEKLLEKQRKKLDKYKFDKTVIPQKTQAHFLKLAFLKKQYKMIISLWYKETRKGYCIIPSKSVEPYLNSWVVNACYNSYSKISMDNTSLEIWEIIQPSLNDLYGLKRRSKNVKVVEERKYLV